MEKYLMVKNNYGNYEIINTEKVKTDSYVNNYIIEDELVYRSICYNNSTIEYVGELVCRSNDIVEFTNMLNVFLNQKENKIKMNRIITQKVKRNIDLLLDIAVMNKAFCDEVIYEFTSEGDIVLDPFMGCGTTAISCIEQKRHYIGFEINNIYIDVANKRIKEALDNISLNGNINYNQKIEEKNKNNFEQIKLF